VLARRRHAPTVEEHIRIWVESCRDTQLRIAYFLTSGPNCVLCPGKNRKQTQAGQGNGSGKISGSDSDIHVSVIYDELFPV
jgi:hypothetical protein